MNDARYLISDRCKRPQPGTCNDTDNTDTTKPRLVRQHGRGIVILLTIHTTRAADNAHDTLDAYTCEGSLYRAHEVGSRGATGEAALR